MFAETLSRRMTSDSYPSHGDVLENIREAFKIHVNINTMDFFFKIESYFKRFSNKIFKY